MVMFWHTEIELTLVVDFQPGSHEHIVPKWHTEIELTFVMDFQPGSRKHTAPELTFQMDFQWPVAFLMKPILFRISICVCAIYVSNFLFVFAGDAA